MQSVKFLVVGDSPIIGAGCWADANVAVSCTGQVPVALLVAFAVARYKTPESTAEPNAETDLCAERPHPHPPDRPESQYNMSPPLSSLPHFPCSK